MAESKAKAGTKVETKVETKVTAKPDPVALAREELLKCKMHSKEWIRAWNDYMETLTVSRRR